MEKGKVFCEECRKDVDFTVNEKQLTGNIKGEVYEYKGKVAHCVDCGAEIYVAEINDFNLRALYDEYREKNDIISLNKVLEICSKYNIGKRPLSLLLGWGEQTFSRYCDGDIPTRQYSYILQRIYEDPSYYNRLLEENKNNLKTDAAYEKSKMAVEKLMQKDLNKTSKINMVFKYLLKQCEDITPLALQKSLYYVQGFYYAFYNKFLFEDVCQAWVHGPVYPEIYNKCKDYRFEPIEYTIEIKNLDFTSSEIAVLDSVAKNICCYSGKILEKFTHSESPWLSARGNLKESERLEKIICKDEIGEYFKQVKEKFNMINPNDIKIYAQTMFKQI